MIVLNISLFILILIIIKEGQVCKNKPAPLTNNELNELNEIIFPAQTPSLENSLACDSW